MLISIKDSSKCETFINIFQHIKLWVPHINLRFSSDKMYAQALDSSHVSVFEISISSSWFDNYEMNEPVTVGVNTQILFRIMNSREDDQSINLYQDGDSLLLDLKTEEENKKDAFNKYFKVPLVDLEDELMEIPDSDYSFDFTIGSKKFKSLIDQLSSFSDTVGVIYQDDKLYIKSESTEEGEMKIEIPIDDLEYAAVSDETSMIKCSYATRYIQMMCQFLKINKEVSISVDENLPMKVVYEIEGEDESKNNYVKFFLAPKISDSD